MQLNELIQSFYIQTSNEEKDVLKKLSRPLPYETFTERDQFIIESLVRKSLVSKVRYGNLMLVVSNEQQFT